MQLWPLISFLALQGGAVIWWASRMSMQLDALSTELTNVRNDIANVRKDVANLRDDVQSHETAIAVMQAMSKAQMRNGHA
jgi:predicted  nucleic acid-binding Zn-ribbon protein